MDEFINNGSVQEIFEKVKRKIIRLDLDFSDEDIYDEIENAIEAINERRHFRPTSSILIEERYKNLAYKLCIASMVKEGAEGETAHSENGINRGYDSSGYPKDLMSQIIPLAKLK